MERRLDYVFGRSKLVFLKKEKSYLLKKRVVFPRRKQGNRLSNSLFMSSYEKSVKKIERKKKNRKEYKSLKPDVLQHQKQNMAREKNVNPILKLSPVKRSISNNNYYKYIVLSIIAGSMLIAGIYLTSRKLGPKT